MAALSPPVSLGEGIRGVMLIRNTNKICSANIWKQMKNMWKSGLIILMQFSKDKKTETSHWKLQNHQM